MGLLLCVFFVSGLFAQKPETVAFDRYHSENLTFTKGLSQNWVYSILQDRYGYMWFGTWDGLNKFDGYNFTIYNVSDGLNDHTILCMVEDKDGNMWIGTNRGLNKFDRQTQTFQKFDFQTADSTRPFLSSIRSIVISGDS